MGATAFVACLRPCSNRQMIDAAHGVDIDGMAAAINEATSAGTESGTPEERCCGRAAQVDSKALPRLRRGTSLGALILQRCQICGIVAWPGSDCSPLGLEG